MLLLALCGQMYGMEVDKVEKASNVMIAAWEVTPETRLDVFDEVIIQKHQNGTYSVKHFSRPKGLRETRCDLKSVIEVTMPNSSTVRAILSHTPDNIELTLPQEESWYTHPVATHSAAVLSTILLMAALFH